MVFFFDLDDTLIDHTSAVRVAAGKLYAKQSLPGTEQAFLAAWQAGIDYYYPRYITGEMTFEASRRARIRETIDPDLDDATADRLFADYLETYESAWTLFDDVLPCLDRLAGNPLGIITNGQIQQQTSKITRFDLGKRCQHIFISEQCGMRKPDANIFHTACRAAGASPADALHIGDSYEADACGARGAGMRGIWLNRYGTASAEHKPPIANSLNELLAVTGAKT